MPDSERELVLCVPRGSVIHGLGWRGIRDHDVQPILDVVAARGQYLRRGEAEDDTAWKQVIPYLLLRDRGRLFLMKRSSAGGDVRLHEHWSIGVGGHLSPSDKSIEAGLIREFEEELIADWHPQLRLLGLLNDDSTAVGEVHLGVVFEADAAGRAVAVRETHKLSGAFVEPAEVGLGFAHLESWSQLLFDYVTRDGPTRPGASAIDSK